MVTRAASNASSLRRVRCALLLVLFTAALPGCTYLKNRANDLLDVVWLDVGVGPGLYAEGRISDFLIQGAGFQCHLANLSLHGRYVGLGRLGGMGLPTLTMAGCTMSIHDPAYIGMVPILGGRSKYDPCHVEPPWSSCCLFFPGLCLIERPKFIPEYSAVERKLRVADIGAAVQYGIGVRAGFSPGELYDFVWGLFGGDPAEDDVFVPGESALEPAPVEGEPPAQPGLSPVSAGACGGGASPSLGGPWTFHLRPFTHAAPGGASAACWGSGCACRVVPT